MSRFCGLPIASPPVRFGVRGGLSTKDSDIRLYRPVEIVLIGPPKAMGYLTTVKCARIILRIQGL